MKQNIILISDLGNNTYMAWGYREGKPLASAVRCKGNDSRKHIENQILNRFASQWMEWKHKGVQQAKVSGARVGFAIYWIDQRAIIDLALGSAPQQQMMPITSRKPKLYEVTVVEGGLKLIKHDAELLDEDEAKLKLFERAVNG